jgi:hypothetical protein
MTTIAEVVKRSRTEQGLPPTVEDRSALELVAGLLLADDDVDEIEDECSARAS